MTLAIRKAEVQDIKSLYQLLDEMRLAKMPGYFEHALEQQSQKRRKLLMGAVSSPKTKMAQDMCYCILNWEPKYGYYKSLGISEIQDINVLPQYRRKGIATDLIGYCEDQARQKGHTQIGISVSVHSSFGPAQKLYAKLGYEPDGFGVTYDRKAVGLSEYKPVDDQLCMMLIKNL